MRAIVVRQFGGPEVMKLEEAPTLKPAAGQVLVRVHAAGVNPADTYARTGNYAVKPNLPYTPGTDGAGIVEAAGEGVSSLKAGDRVYIGRNLTGTYAEYALALESQVHRLPQNISFAQGAGVYVPYGTAFHAYLHHAQTRAGQTVLIHGASGGVGIAAVQVGRAMGLQVFGTAGTAKGLELAKREGAHQVFDHSQEGYRDAILKATNGKGVDLILEMLANVNLGHDLKLIALNGQIVVIGSRGDVTVTPRDLMARRGAVRAFTLWAVTEPEAREIHAAIEAGLENGTLRPVVGKELPLKDAPKAHEDVMAPGAFGKIVLVP
ncbi:MAG TPA: NADPH:quinone reductase [Candidatus Acidoferrales bacterium]|nr:NADPH:quinone reductase [Candidatus Acidoferrales bacterium]